jgi:hypothetical protein
LCLLISAFAYALYVDWPAFDEPQAVRVYLPVEYPIEDAHHYKLRSFMDTWDLYKFTTSSSAIAHLKSELKLESRGYVQNFDLIISKPPAYWWEPEKLDEAELFQSTERADDGRLYELLYSEETGITYLIRFDG